VAHPRKQATRWLSLAQQPAADKPQQGDLLQDDRRKENVASPASASPMPAAATLLPPAAPAPLREADELWLALVLPSLWLTAAARVKVPTGPLILLGLHNRMQRVLAADAAARELGITPGSSLASALAVCPQLDARERNLRQERALLDELAVNALNFTPRVSLERPDSLLLEIKGSLDLFGGVQPLCKAVLQSCQQRGVAVQLALAPTPLAALAGARAGCPLRIIHMAQLVGEIAALPLSALGWPADQLERLASMGVRHIGQVLRLPREGFTRRFGKAQRLLLDRLTGQAADPRPGFIARERFAARCEPSYELTDHAAILQYCEPLLADLEHFLRSRQAGISELLLRFMHRRPGGLASERIVTPLRLRLVEPQLAAQRFLSLLHEYLARLQLPGPVLRIELRSGRLLPFAPCSQSLWQLGEHGGAPGSESPAFLERLRARLGPDAVYGLCLVPEHRPEAAWRVAEPRIIAQSPAAATNASQNTHKYTNKTDSNASGAHLHRPLWLLREPQPLPVLGDVPGTAGLELHSGPERIESGWWDGHDVARDYYLARNTQGAELWVFRERQAPHHWYLHGVFG
jgi:protein ImuB